MKLYQYNIRQDGYGYDTAHFIKCDVSSEDELVGIIYDRFPKCEIKLIKVVNVLYTEPKED